MTRIDTVEAARLLRAALKATWPGVRFSVRRGQGTSADWLYVGWIDGPVVRQVQALADQYRGYRFNAMTDTLDDRPATLFALDGESPEPVRFDVEGINPHRQIGPDGIAAVAAAVLRVAPDAEPLNATGTHLTYYQLDATSAAMLTEGLYTVPATVWDVAHFIHARTDLTTAHTASADA